MGRARLKKNRFPTHERQCLIIRGRQLVDGKRLYESNVFDGATVQLCVKLALRSEH